MIRLVSPAPLLDVLDLYTERVAFPQHFRQMVTLGFARSRSFGLMDGDQLLAVAMLWPDPPEQPGEQRFELMFHCRAELRACLPALIRAARATRRTLPDTERIRAIVRTDAGARLARLCGMVPLPRTGANGVYEIEGLAACRSLEICCGAAAAAVAPAAATTTR